MTRARELAPSPLAATPLREAASDAPLARAALASPSRGPTADDGFVVDDETTQLTSGQMHKSVFLARLRQDACAAADLAMASSGRSTDGCPVVERWLDYYATRDARQVERAVRRFAPAASRAASADELVPLVSERIAAAVARWAVTGELPAAGPDEVIAAGGPETPPVAGPAFADAGGARPGADPSALLSRLGPGAPLDGSTRSRLEPVLGHSFAGVRVHDDPIAAGLASELRARAFAVGDHVAFARGERQPGTTVGDALMAHELAHVAGADSEREADAAALGAVLALHGDGDDARSPTPVRASPRAGLRLSRCGAARNPVAVPLAGQAGTFSVDMIRKRRRNESTGDAQNGLDGTISFTPHPAVCSTCRSIALVQIARVAAGRGDYDWSRNAGGDVAWRNQVRTRQGETAAGTRDPSVRGGFFVDTFAEDTTQYQTLETPVGTGSTTPRLVAAPVATCPEAVTLRDDPGGGDGEFLHTFEFETAAVCLETGQRLGSVHWGFTYTGMNDPVQSTPVAGPVSSTFDDAIERYLRRFPGARGVGRATRSGAP